MDWKDFNHDGPADGRMILARFPGGPIECHCELDGFYTRDDRLITDSLGAVAAQRAARPAGPHRHEDDRDLPAHRP